MDCAVLAHFLLYSYQLVCSWQLVYYLLTVMIIYDRYLDICLHSLAGSDKIKHNCKVNHYWPNSSNGKRSFC